MVYAVFGPGRTGHLLERNFESGDFMNVKRLLFVALCSGIVMSAAEQFSLKTVVQATGSSVSQYLVALPHIAYGGAWRTQIVIANTSAAAADITLYYYDSNGNPLSLAIGGISSNNTAVTVAANGQVTIEPDWGGAETSAWVGLVYTNIGLKIQGIFLWHNPTDPAGKYTQAVAPIVSQAGAMCIIPLPSGSSTTSMLYDQTGGYLSGYGFANTTNAAATLSLTFYDQNGAMVGVYSEPLPAFGHDSFLIGTKVPALANTKGWMQISGQGIVPLGFRFKSDFTFTTWLP
jgi:hypothetical protein